MQALVKSVEPASYFQNMFTESKFIEFLDDLNVQLPELDTDESSEEGGETYFHMYWKGKFENAFLHIDLYVDNCVEAGGTPADDIVQLRWVKAKVKGNENGFKTYPSLNDPEFRRLMQDMLCESGIGNSGASNRRLKNSRPVSLHETKSNDTWPLHRIRLRDRF